MKPSNNQKRTCNYIKTLNTLDFCHKSSIMNFDSNNDLLHKFEDELLIIDNDISIIQQVPNNIKCDDDFKNIVILYDKHKDITKKINDIKTNKHELQYFINTSDILYNYYHLVENNDDSKMDINVHVCNNNTNKKSILDYFKNNNDNTDILNDKDKNNEVINITQVTEHNRASLLDDYLSVTDKHYINNNIDNNIAIKCDFCNSLDKTIVYNDSISFCNSCLAVQHLITDNEKPSYKDPPKEISYFSYKRINHYQEWLNQIQGKETTDIPEEVFDKIMLELKKQRIINTKELTRTKIKEILKKLKINKYYEHIPYILNRITGIPNPNLTQELEEKLRNMFKEIQVPFLKHSPLYRKNFLSYSYVIHKFIQILEKDEYLKFFPLLKSRDKLHQQEQIWKNICIDLGWKFIRSI
jgi:hypothetical protein